MFNHEQIFLISSVQEALKNYDYSTASFLGERLSALTPEEDASAIELLLATVYYRSGKPNRAYHVLKGSCAPDNIYLFALCWYVHVIGLYFG